MLETLREKLMQLYEAVGLLPNAQQVLGLQNETFGDYKVRLIQERCSLEKQLRANWIKLKGKPDLEKPAIIAKIATITAKLDKVYEVQNARARKGF